MTKLRTYRYRVHRDQPPATRCRCGKLVSLRYDFQGASAELARHQRFDDPESSNLDRHEDGE